jgi:hypothetical protein
MDKKDILITILTILLVSSIIFIFVNNSSNRITGEVISNPDYTWTKAICNENRECIDIQIACSDGKVKNIIPVSGLLNLSDYIDPRSQEDLDKWCE